MENNVQQPQYQPPVAPEQKPSNGLAIASLVLGILSIIMVFVYAWVGIDVYKRQTARSRSRRAPR